MTGPWEGRSLAYFRRLLREDPKYASPRDAMNDSKLEDGDPEIGGVVWYMGVNGHPYGNVALCIERGLVLAINSLGDPSVRSWDDGYLGFRVGWSWRIGGKEGGEGNGRSAGTLLAGQGSEDGPDRESADCS